MVSVRWTKHVFGMSGGEHSHKARACLLHFFFRLCWAQGPDGEVAALRRWRWYIFGCRFSFGPSATRNWRQGPAVAIWLVAMTMTTTAAGLCQGWVGRSPDTAAYIVPPLSHPSLISAELELWDLFNTRAVAVAGSHGLALVHQSNKDTVVSGKGREAVMQRTRI